MYVQNVKMTLTIVGGCSHEISVLSFLLLGNTVILVSECSYFVKIKVTRCTTITISFQEEGGKKMTFLIIFSGLCILSLSLIHI